MAKSGSTGPTSDILGLGADEIARHLHAVQHGDRRAMPGATRASAGISTSVDDVDRLVAVVVDIASGRAAPVTCYQDPTTGDYNLDDGTRLPGADRALGASCARG